MLEIRVEACGIVVVGLHQRPIPLHDFLIEEDGGLVGVRDKGDVLLLFALDVIEIGPGLLDELLPIWALGRETITGTGA